mmetsp:Transcript_3174/g.4369  ORF Transcript_3174/g.4369 Transcript_3174/m.4369 type:complete len:154 (+) Transcript_3174:86-547(+)
MGKKGRRNRRKNQQSERSQTGSGGAASSNHGVWSGKGNVAYDCSSAEMQQEVQPLHQDLITLDLVNIILARGVPEHLNSSEKLKAYLCKVYYGSKVLSSFFAVLTKALESGPPVINTPLPLSAQMAAQQMPLLSWMCQYRFSTPDWVVGFRRI